MFLSCLCDEWLLCRGPALRLVISCFMMDASSYVTPTTHSCVRGPARISCVCGVGPNWSVCIRANQPIYFPWTLVGAVTP
jgi:hypothetical protein